MNLTNIFVLCSAIASSLAIDYCNDKETRCDACCTGHHVRCGKTDGQFGPSCTSNATMIEMTDEMKKIILDFYNMKRNDIALGKVPPYESATRMATMKWDDDLAKNSDFNVRSCQFGHDPCRTTPKFNAAGQNVAIDLYDLQYNNLLKKYTGPPGPLVQSLVSGWYDLEYKNGDMQVINDLQLPADEFDPKQIGHFTHLIWDNAYSVGCAAIKFMFDNGGQMTNAAMLTCDYALGNVPHAKVYVSGPAASGCKTGTNPTYPGLCSENETWESSYFN